jgi:putative protease
MKFAVTIQETKMLQNYIDANVDVLIVQNKDITPRGTNSFEMDDLASMIEQAHQEHVAVYLQMTLMIHEDSVQTVKKWLEWAKKQSIDGILFADTGVIPIAKAYGILDRLMYQPGTLTTNTYDLTFWKNQGLKGIVLAREITLKDIVKFKSDATFRVGIIGHGYLNMFHSKRPLITNFYKYQEIDEPVYEQLELVEEKRQERYPVVENTHGTHIFRPKPMHSFEALDALEQVIDLFIIDGVLKDDMYTLNVLKDYHRAIENPNERIKMIKKYSKDHDTGFFNKETKYHAS